MRTIRVVVADDNPVVRVGLRSLLDSADEIEVVGEAADGAEAVDLVARLAPDVVLLDVRMPRLDGVRAASKIASRAKVIMLTASDDPETVQAALISGASGYLVHGAHSPEEIISAVVGTTQGAMVLGPAAAAAAVSALAGSGEPGTGRASGAGSFGLTAREWEVMDLVADGLSNREIARRCFVTEKTVKNHLNRIFDKLGVHSRAEAVSRWLRASGDGVRRMENDVG